MAGEVACIIVVHRVFVVVQRHVNSQSCGDALVCMPKCIGMQAPVMMRQACTDGPCSKDAQPPRLADYTTATMKPGCTRSTFIDLKHSSFMSTTRVASPLHDLRNRYVPGMT